MTNHFANFPDSSRVWVYAFDHTLSDQEAGIVSNELNEFLEEWNSHGEPVDGRFFLMENRILIIAGQCADAISGCSIDSKVRVFKNLANNHGMNSFGYDRVFYRNSSNQITSSSRSEFKSKLSSGLISNTTNVFDLTIDSLDQLRRGELEVPLANSWHNNAIKPSTRNSATA